jgi:hypothetical protein
VDIDIDNSWWLRYKIQVLKKVELKLSEMRLLALYARNNDLGKAEISEIQSRLDLLKIEIDFLLNEKNDFVH